MAKIKDIEKSKINIFEALRINQDSVLSRLNCHAIGKILEFDPNAQMCTVELMQTIQFQNQSFQPVPITQVPLVIYGAGTGHITLPNPEGTICLLLFNDRNMDNFKLTGEQYEPNSTRMHDYSDCIALTTFKTFANPLENYDERAISIFNKELIEEITYDSFIKVYGNQILINSIQQGEGRTEASISIAPNEIQTSAQTLMQNIDNQTTNAKNQISLKSSLGGEIDINSFITVKNTAQSLAQLIQAFLAACEGITIVGGATLTSESREAFTTLKTQFEELFV